MKYFSMNKKGLQPKIKVYRNFKEFSSNGCFFTGNRFQESDLIFVLLNRKEFKKLNKGVAFLSTSATLPSSDEVGVADMEKVYTSKVSLFSPRLYTVPVKIYSKKL